MRTDWQSIVTLAIGLMAAVYLARRWWPGIKGLWAPAASEGTTNTTSCGSAAPAASCSSGCGNCSSSTTASGKDHRIHIVHRSQS